MIELSDTRDTLPTSSPEMVSKVTALEQVIRDRPQVEIRTEHTFHAGMYARTVRVPAGVVFTSVLAYRASHAAHPERGVRDSGRQSRPVDGGLPRPLRRRRPEAGLHLPLLT